jgi:hypothetical protein
LPWGNITTNGPTYRVADKHSVSSTTYKSHEAAYKLPDELSDELPIRRANDDAIANTHGVSHSFPIGWSNYDSVFWANGLAYTLPIGTTLTVAFQRYVIFAEPGPYYAADSGAHGNNVTHGTAFGRAVGWTNEATYFRKTNGSTDTNASRSHR